MTSTELKNMFMGRKIRPYSLAIMYVTFITSWSLLVKRNGPGKYLDSTFSAYIIGVIGVGAVLFLFLGFWLRKDNLMMIGLLFTSGVWCARGVYILLEQGIVESAMLSFGWVIASVGAFFLEYIYGDHSLFRRRRV